MERCEAMRNETPWICIEFGEAPSTCDGAMEARSDLERGRTTRPVFGFLSSPLGTDLEGKGKPWIGFEARARPSPEADGPATAETREAAASGGDGVWVSQRALDLEADRDPDPQGIRCSVPSQPSLASPPILWLELSGSGTTRDPARRRGHRPLETPQLAP